MERGEVWRKSDFYFMSHVLVGVCAYIYIDIYAHPHTDINRRSYDGR